MTTFTNAPLRAGETLAQELREWGTGFDADTYADGIVKAAAVRIEELETALRALIRNRRYLREAYAVAYRNRAALSPSERPAPEAA